MSTQLFLTTDGVSGPTSTPYNWRPGTSYPELAFGGGIWPVLRQTSTSRGSGVTSSAARATVNGPTNGLEYGIVGGDVINWITPPIDQDVTFSGTVTFNIWASESSMSANCGAQVVADIIRATDASRVEIVNSERAVEYGTSASANNWTASAGGVTANKGDRIRIIVAFNDANGTMNSGFTSTLRYNGNTAAADGDTYVTFAETFGFQTTDPTGTTVYLTDTNSALDSSTATGFAACTVGEFSDAAGPNWSNASNITSSNNSYASVTTVTIDSDNLIAKTFGFSIPAGNVPRAFEVKVEGKSGLGASNNARVNIRVAGGAAGIAKTFTLGTVEGTTTLGSSTDAWGIPTQWMTESEVESTDFGCQIVCTGDNDTFDIDYVEMQVHYGPTFKARDAWTSRGSGVQTDVTNTTTGPTNPLLITDTAGTQYVEWYTRRLNAFTLSGVVLVNERCKQANVDASNAATRVEIARCNSDGSSATVWGTNQDWTETTTSETAHIFYVSGDDLAVSDGQRLRLRLYIDDATFTMVANETITNYYAGTSGGASGDTFFTFEQTLTEFVEAGRVPKFSPYPQLLAH